MAQIKRRSHRDVYHAEIVRSLHAYDIWTRSQETGKFAQTEPGSADIMAHLNGKGCAIEVKTGYNNSFSFSEWRDNQREWAREYREKTHCEYWLAVIIETKYARWRVKRAAFLVPYPHILMAIDSCPIDSVPYIAGKGSRIEMQNNNIDAQFIWAGNELIWGNGKWIIPETSNFYKAYFGEN